MSLPKFTWFSNNRDERSGVATWDDGQLRTSQSFAFFDQAYAINKVIEKAYFQGRKDAVENAKFQINLKLEELK